MINLENFRKQIDLGIASSLEGCSDDELENCSSVISDLDIVEYLSEQEAEELNVLPIPTQKEILKPLKKIYAEMYEAKLNECFQSNYENRIEYAELMSDWYSSRGC